MENELFSIYIKKLAQKTPQALADWIESLIGGSQLKPTIPFNGMGEDLLVLTATKWLELAKEDKQLEEPLVLFRESIYEVFVATSRKNSAENSLYFVDIPTQLNRYIYFFNFCPYYFRSEYKIALGALLTVQNSPLLKWTYGEDRNIYFALLDVFIRWSNSLPNERINGYEKSFRDFLFNHINTFSDSGYSQVALKYFSNYLFENEFFNFLNSSIHTFRNYDDLLRLSDSLYYLYTRRGERVKREIISWLHELSWVPKSLVVILSEWFAEITILLDEKNTNILDVTFEEKENIISHLEKFTYEESIENYSDELKICISINWEATLSSILDFLKMSLIRQEDMDKFSSFFFFSLTEKEDEFGYKCLKNSVMCDNYTLMFINSNNEKAQIQIVLNEKQTRMLFKYNISSLNDDNPHDALKKYMS